MRHFLSLALAPPALAPGVMQPTAKRPLVALPSRTQALPPRLPCARIGAISLPVIAAPAHPQRPLTARTVEQSVTDDVDRTTSSHKRLDAAGESRHGVLRDQRNVDRGAHSPKARGGKSSGLHLLWSCRC